MQSLVLLLSLAVGTDPASTPSYPFRFNSQQSVQAQDKGAMPGMTMRGQEAMPGMDMGKTESMSGMSGMGMNGMNMNGMDGMGMGSMAMTPGMMAMGKMAFMDVMGSRAEPGCLMRLLFGCDPSMANMGMNQMGSMNGMQMGDKDSMPGMKMNGKDSQQVRDERAKLSAEDRRLVEAQEWCPITGMRLGSMGPPIKILLKGQPVFLCCPNCPEAARAEPDKTLAEVARLKERKAKGGTDPDGTHPMAGMAGDQMGSLPRRGCLKHIPCDCDDDMSNMGMGHMGSMNGMGMGDMGSMPGMKMNGKDSQEVLAERAKLSAEDRLLVEAQEWCPITGMRLGSMGPPLKIVLKGQPVFLCCPNCPDAARADPDKTLAEVARLKQRKAQGGTEPEGKSSMSGMGMGNMGSMNGMAMNNTGSMAGMNGMGGMDMNNPGFSINGWTDMSFTASSARDSNLPMGFNYKANQFLLQQSWLRLDYAVDEHATLPSFGFRSDWILPGSDYRFTLARGIFNEQLTANDGMPNTYGIDPIHFYGEVYLPGIAEGMDIKVGRWCMLHGVEMNEATMNLFASHSYTYLADPFTHTGVLTTTRLNKQFVVQAAITTGSDIFFDSGEAATFVGGFQWFSASERTSLKFMTVLGPGRFDQQANFDNRNLFDVVLRQRLGEHVYYAIEGLYGYEDNVPDLGTAHWWGIVQYLTYEVNSKLAPSLRLEFFDDVDGQRTFFPGLYTAVTANVYYRPRPWLTLRPEIRYDNSEGKAFEGRHQLFTATADVILQW